MKRAPAGRTVGAALAAAAATLCLASVGPVAPAPAAAQGLVFVKVWSRTLPDAGHPVALSSPNVATLEGVPAVVVGDRAGYVYALSLAGGRAVPGWPASTGGAPVDSTPSVAQLGGDPANDTVFVGTGNASTPHVGGYEAFDPDGTRRWYAAVKNPVSDRTAGATSAVTASLAVGDLQGSLDVVAPSVGQEEYALDAGSGATLAGFPWFSADSGFSTPALADLYSNGRTDIVEGGDQTAGLAFGVDYTQGGHVRVLAPTGNAGTGSPTGGLDCEANPDVGVESSPAVGGFLAGGAPGIVVGTGTTFKGSDTDKVLAFNPQCQLVWQVALNGMTESSPALADVEGNGTLAVVEGTDGGPGGGSVYALGATNGAVIWSRPVGAVHGGVVTADLGRGHQDVIVASTRGAEVLDGTNGRLVTILERGVGLQNSPLVTEDPNGTIGITVAGYNGHNQGEIEHFELAGSSGASVAGPGAWPVFHHDPQLTGDAGVPGAGGERAGPQARPAGGCAVPPGGPNGYYEVDKGGRVFGFGNLARCGSLDAPAQGLAQPVAGMAATPDGGGYWLVDQAGQVFAFGDARSYGSLQRLRSGMPVVALTATPHGQGYWLLTAGGQVYAFGDARSYGPRVALHPPAPVVGMAATADGRGYWVVDADGTVWSFGDAPSRQPRLAVRSSSVVGIAADTATAGYWLVSSHGAVYPFGAPFLGSVPAGTTETAIAGIQAEPGGSGYRLVDGGGALFCFGTATQLGSAATAHPTRAVVGIASP
ncbi:MAG: hypothetical protein ABSE77_04390 [Acidimicrobiales bacterium]|jgi:hypothetical protein